MLILQATKVPLSASHTALCSGNNTSPGERRFPSDPSTGSTIHVMSWWLWHSASKEQGQSSLTYAFIAGPHWIPCSVSRTQLQAFFYMNSLNPLRSTVRWALLLSPSYWWGSWDTEKSFAYAHTVTGGIRNWVWGVWFWPLALRYSAVPFLGTKTLSFFRQEEHNGDDVWLRKVYSCDCRHNAIISRCGFNMMTTLSAS